MCIEDDKCSAALSEGGGAVLRAGEVGRKWRQGCSFSPCLGGTSVLCLQRIVSLQYILQNSCISCSGKFRKKYSKNLRYAFS